MRMREWRMVARTRIGFAFLASLAILLLLYPKAFFMRIFLMFADASWTLQDPAVTSLSFVPGHDVFRELSGSALEVKPANITFRALLLLEKRHYRISFDYEPRWLGMSGLLLGFSLVCVLLMSYWAFRTEQRESS